MFTSSQGFGLKGVGGWKHGMFHGVVNTVTEARQPKAGGGDGPAHPNSVPSLLVLILVSGSRVDLRGGLEKRRPDFI